MRCRDKAAIVGDTHRDTDHRRDEDTDQQCAAHVLHHQHRRHGKTYHRQQRAARGDLAQRYERRVVVAYDTGILQADEGYEETDTGAYGILERGGDGIHYGLAQIRKREDHEDDTLDEYGRQSELPRIAHTHTYGEYEEGIKSHSGRQSEGELGPERHDKRTGYGGQSRSREDGAGGHAVQLAEHSGVDGQNVRHGKECGDTRQDLRARRGHRRIESEQFLKHISSVFTRYKTLRSRQKVHFAATVGMA